MKRSNAQFLLDALTYFELYPQAKEYEDVSRAQVLDSLLKIIQGVPGYEEAEEISITEAKEILRKIVSGEISATVPENLQEILEDWEKHAEEKKAGKVAAEEILKWKKQFKQKLKAAIEEPAPTRPKTETTAAERVVVKISPEALRFFEQSIVKATGAPLKLAAFFSTPKLLSEVPQVKNSLAFAISLPKIAERAKGLPEPEQRRLLEFVENLRQAEFSFFAQTKLSRRLFSIREITLLLGPEIGLSQGQVAALIQGGAPPGKKPSLLRRLFGSLAQRAIAKTATKAVGSALTKAGISISTKAVAGGVGTAVGGPLGTILGLVVGWLADKTKDLISWFKRNAPKVAIGLGAFIFGTGFVLQSTFLMSAGGTLAAGGFIGQAGGVGPALSKVASGASTFLTGFLSLTIASIATPLVVTLISLPIVVAIILFIINSGAYVVPPAPFAEAPLFGIPIECTEEKASLSFSKTTSSPIAERAWEITADLYQGFWCFWNRSPDDFPEDTVLYPPSYPELFNESYFARNPNPSRAEISTCGNCMFWCTYLVQKSYRETGNTSLLVTLWSPTMQQDFIRRNKFIPSGDATPKNVKPGSVIFFKITPGPNRTNHVAIVHSVNRDGINYVQSNAPSKDSFLSFNESGVGIQSPPGIEVVGIGLP